MTMYILTVTSRSGERVNPITGEPTDSIAVYSKKDLDRRREAARQDPRDLKVTWRKVI